MNDLRIQIEQSFTNAGITLYGQDIYLQFEAYLDLLTRWNEKLNLTAVRDPEQMILRHFVECAFAAQHLPSGKYSLLDYGSGAGLPGIPFAICNASLNVTLAEANAKKASFLREAVRSIPLKCEVLSGRVESLPRGRTFDAVSLRAVERMESAIPVAVKIARKWLILLTTQRQLRENQEAAEGAGVAIRWQSPLLLPGSMQRLLCVGELN